MGHNIFNMAYEEVRKYDCGSIGNPRFPDVQKSASYPIPDNLLSYSAPGFWLLVVSGPS